MTTDTIVIERTYPVRIEKVWQAITDADKLNEWFFKTTVFRLEKVFEFEISDGTGKPRHCCCITDFIQGRMITFSFFNIRTTGTSQVTYELFDEGESTRFQLTHTGLETFPQDEPGYNSSDYQKGWTYLFANSLPKYLEQKYFKKKTKH